MGEKRLLLTTLALPTSLAGMWTYISGNFSPLLYLMLIFCFFDYTTRIALAIKKEGKPNLDVVLWNLVKKVFFFMVIAIAFGLDYTIYQSTYYLYGEIEWRAYFGMLSIVILIATEGLDILINLEEFDIKVPFLSEALKVFREKIQGNKNNKAKKDI